MRAMTVMDPSKHDWTKSTDYDVACAAEGGVREAIVEAKRRGMHDAAAHGEAAHGKAAKPTLRLVRGD